MEKGTAPFDQSGRVVAPVKVGGVYEGTLHVYKAKRKFM